MSPFDTNRSQGVPTRYGRKVEIPESELHLTRQAPRHQPRRGRAKAILVLSLLIVVVVIVSTLAYTFLLPGDGNTPEEAFLAIMEAVDDDDDERLIGCSVACFADGASKEMACTELECQLWTFMTRTTVLNSYELVKGDESAYIQQSLNEISDYNERTYSVDVSDCCAIIANYTVYIEGNAFTEEQPFPFVKIGSDWFLALIPLPEGQVIVESQELSAC